MAALRGGNFVVVVVMTGVRIPNLKKKYVEIRQISNCDPEHIDYKNTIFPMLRKNDYAGHFLKFGFFM